MFGEGAPRARLMLVGEQPGDAEDLAGHPFVGPAGRLLDRALEAGRNRSRRGVRHQRGQALQMGAARQTADSQEAECRRDRGVPSLARHGDRARQAARARLPRRHRRPGAARARLQVTAQRGEFSLFAARADRRWPRCTRPRFCARPTMRRGTGRCSGSSTTCGAWPARCARHNALSWNVAPSLAPTLLLSMPQLVDPTSRARSCCSASTATDGAFGLVVNRPLVTTGRVVVNLDPPVETDRELQVWVGGPVEPQRSWMLVGSDGASDERVGIRVADRLSLSTSPDLLRRMLEPYAACRRPSHRGLRRVGPRGSSRSSSSRPPG